MKRVSLILGIALTAVIVSCSTEEFEETISEDSSDKVNFNGILVKQIQTTSERGSATITDVYSYDKKKLLKVSSSDGREVVYTYSGDIITERAFYDNGSLNSKEKFEYQKGTSGSVLSSYQRLSASGTLLYKAVFQNNSDGTVAVKGYKNGVVNQSNELVNRKVFVNNGIVTKIESYKTVNGNVVAEVLNYKYDHKNSPFKNIVGFNKLAYYDMALNGNSNNITSVTNGSVTVESVQYTYNGNDFPISAAKGSVTFSFRY